MDSSKLTIILNKNDQTFSKSQFKSYIVSMSSNRIAVGYRNNLMFTSLIGSSPDVNVSYTEPEREIELNPFFEISMELNEIYGDISVLKWLSDDVLCVGFESGLLACYDDEGDFLVEHHFHEEGIPIQTVKLSEKYKENHGGMCLYILFEDGYLVGVSLTQLLASKPKKSSPDTREVADLSNISTYKFELNSQEITSDFVVVPFNRHTTNSHDGITYMTPVHINGYELYYESILTSGYNCALAYHHLGTPKPKSNVNKLVTNIKEKVSKAISKNITGSFSSFFGFGKEKEAVESKDVTVKDTNQAASATEAILPTNQLKLQHLSSDASYEFHDSKRRIMRMSLDPSGKLVATADSLGRVMLFDSRLHCMIRMWKGIRDARFAWTVGYTNRKRSGTSAYANTPPSSNTKQYKRVYSKQKSASSLCLAIYAPQLGLLSLFSMRHGPCVRTVPVGQHCQIFSIFEVSPVTGESVSKCALMEISDDEGSIEISVVSPNEHDCENELDGDQSMSDVYGKTSTLSELLNEVDRSESQTSTSEYDEDTMFQLKQLLQSVAGNEDTASNRRKANSNAQLVNVLTRRIENSNSYGNGYGNGYENDTENQTPSELTLSAARADPDSLSPPVADGTSTVVIVNSEEANKERDEQIRLIVSKLLDPTVEMRNGKKPLIPGHSLSHSRNQTPLPASTPPPSGLPRSQNALDADVLTSTIEADVWLALSHITTTDALYACVELIDMVERDRECPTPTFVSATVPPAVTASFCAYVASSKRFSMQFHKDVCELIIKVGSDTGNQMVVVEGCMRKRLLLAYEKLASYSSVSTKELLHSSGNNVFDLSKNSGAGDPVALLVKQNTARSEAFCWISRACGKYQQFNDDSKAQLKREVHQMMQVNPKNYLLSSSHGSVQGTTRVRSPVLSPSDSGSGISSPIGDRRKTHASGSAPFVSPGTGTSGKSCTLPNITFSMFLAFHRFVWYKTDTDEEVPLNLDTSGNTPNSNLFNDLCCVVEFRGDMLVDIMNSAASQVTYKMQQERIHHARQQYDLRNPDASVCPNPVVRSNIPPHMIYYDQALIENTQVPSLGTPLPPLARNGSTAAGEPMLSPSVSVNSLSSMSSFYSTSSNSGMTRSSSFLSPTVNSSGKSTYLSFQKKNPSVSTTPLGGAAITPENSSFSSIKAYGGHAQVRVQSPAVSTQDDDSAQLDCVVYYGHVPIYPTACGTAPCIQTHKSQSPRGVNKKVSSDIGNKSWKVPIWAAYDLLGLLMTPLVVKLDVFAIHDYCSVVLEHMGLGNGWGLRSFLPLLICYLENIPATVDTAPSDIALQSSSIVMNLLLYKQQASTSPIQRWLRDVLLSFQDALHVDLDEEQQIMEGLMERSTIADQGAVLSPLDVELVEYMNEHLKLITTRSIFVNQLMASGNGNSESDAGSKEGGYSYDDAIRFALRPVWLQMRDSVIFAPGHEPNLIRGGAFCSTSEIMMGLGALFLETMGAVSEQLERRTYGLDSLQATMEIWEILFKQYRVAILIGSRIPLCPVGTLLSSVNLNRTDFLLHYRKTHQVITVKALHEGENSMYRILAEDTLCFSLHADQATEHESRCHAVYLKHSSLTGGGGPATLGNAASGSTPVHFLAAWGEGANRRWKEILAVVEAENGPVVPEKQPHTSKIQQVLSQTGNGSGTPSQNTATPFSNANSNRNAVRRRKPLLLFFPLHNQQVPLGAYRSLILAERWFKHPHSVELLSHSVSHLYPLPPVTKGAIAQHICYYYLFPFLRSYWLMEEGFNTSISNHSKPTGRSSVSPATTPKSYETPCKGSNGGISNTAASCRNSETYGTNKEGILPPPVPVMEISKEFLFLIRNHHQNVNFTTNAGSHDNPNHRNNSELIRELIQAALDLISFADVLFRVKAKSPESDGLTVSSEAVRNEEGSQSEEDDDMEEYFDALDTLPGVDAHVMEKGSVMGDEFSRTITSVSERCRPNAVSILNIQEEHQMEVRSVANLVADKAGQSDRNQGSQYSGVCWPSPGDIVLSHIVREFQTKGGGNKVAVKAHCALLLIILLRILCNLRRIRPSELFFARNNGNILDYMCLPDCISMNSSFREYFNDDCEFSEKANCKSKDNKNKNGSNETGKAMEKVIQIRHEFVLQCFRSLQHNFTAVVYRLGELWCIPVDTMRLYHIQVLLEAGNDDLAEEIVTMISSINDVVDCVTNGLRFRVGVCLSRIDHIPQYGSLIMSMDAEAVAWGRSAITIPADPMIIDLIATGKQKPIDFDVNASKHLVIRLQGLLLSISNGSKRDHYWHKRKNKCDMLLSLLTSLANYLRSR